MGIVYPKCDNSPRQVNGISDIYTGLRFARIVMSGFAAELQIFAAEIQHLTQGSEIIAKGMAGRFLQLPFGGIPIANVHLPGQLFKQLP